MNITQAATSLDEKQQEHGGLNGKSQTRKAPDEKMQDGGRGRGDGAPGTAAQKREEGLLEKLTAYAASEMYPLHMPGHKRRISQFEHPFSIDITEIEGFDNLFEAKGILGEAQRRAADLYGAEETFYLINGSTCGILAAVSAAVRRGGTIVMARNSHKSAYHAAFLNGLDVTWVYPEMDMRRGIYGSVSPAAVREALSQGKNQKAVLITSPTYDGVVSDIRAIAEEVHRAGAILIVDEAHGAHFVMDPYFPETALACGADVVINSLHKTLPSLTQTALLHVRGERVDRARLKRYLGIYQSSSPSYVLMAGMDACIRQMQTQGRELFGLFTQRLEELRGELEGMERLHLVSGNEPELSAYGFDRSKILISTEESGLSGPALGRILRRIWRLEPEMEAERYVTAILTAADSREGFDRLREALLETDRRLQRDRRLREPCGRPGEALTLLRPRAVLTMEEAETYLHRPVSLNQSAGNISAETVCLYPPGIPLLVPGEEIPEGFGDLLHYYAGLGLHVQGLADETAESILCAKREQPNGQGPFGGESPL